MYSPEAWFAFSFITFIYFVWSYYVQKQKQKTLREAIRSEPE